MRKQDQLNALIAGLSKQEKRYFKLHASLQSGDKKFIQLFDELQKTESYEPERLAKKLQLSKPLLGHVKNYLQDELLRSLRLFSEDKNLTMSLYNRWNEARLLHNRNQHELAYSINEKALEKAMAYENFSVTHNLLALKYNLLVFLQSRDNGVEVARQINLTIERLAEIQQLMNLLIRFQDVAGGITSKDSFKDIAATPIFKTRPAKLKSNSSRILWYELHQSYAYYVKRDLKTAVHHNLCKLQIFEAHPQLIYTWPNSYVISLGYLSSHYGELEDYEKALGFSEYMERETDGRRKDLPVNYCKEFNPVSRSAQVYLLCYMGRFQKAIEKGSGIWSDKKKMQVHFMIMGLHFYALAHFHTGRYDEALKICEDMQSMNSDAMQNIQLFNKILLVMIHYALKNYSLLPYLINSAAAWSNRHEMKVQGTHEIIRWLRRLEKDAPAGKQKLFFKEFKAAVDKNVFKRYTNNLMLKHWTG